MIDFETLTNETLDQLYLAQLMPELDPGMVMETAIQGVCEGVTLGHQPGILTDWHSYLAHECSDLYHSLRSQLPGVSKEVVNSDPDLKLLNTFRRAVRATRDKRAVEAAENKIKWRGRTIS